MLLPQRMPAIRMRGVGRRFGDRWAVRDVDLDIPEGQTVALIGASGSGKTTLLRLINRLLECTTGTIELFGSDVRVGDPAELRRRVGYVIQEIGIFPHYTVAQNIALVPKLLGWQHGRIAERVTELLELVGLPYAEFAGRYPRELSGGQRQRVGFARALAADPPLILLDEPFGALDPITRDVLQGEFKALTRRLAKTFVLVTHDMVEAARVAERVVVLHEARVVQDGSPRELIRRPAHPVVEGLLGRHRYQLELLSVSLERAALKLLDRDLAGASLPPLGPERSSEREVELPPSASLWDALDELSAARAARVRVTTSRGPQVLSREQLVLAVLESS